MFDYIGGKIKTLATTITILGIVAAIIYGFIVGNEADSFFIGLLSMVFGSILSWISAFVLYGYGELIETLEEANSNISSNTAEIHKILNILVSKYEKESVKPAPKAFGGPWTCPKCNMENDSNSLYCKDCGTYK